MIKAFIYAMIIIPVVVAVASFFWLLSINIDDDIED